jgi:hypothetical protein
MREWGLPIEAARAAHGGCAERAHQERPPASAGLQSLLTLTQPGQPKAQKGSRGAGGKVRTNGEPPFVERKS